MNGHDDLTAFDMDVPRQDILDSIIETVDRAVAGIHGQVPDPALGRGQGDADRPDADGAQADVFRRATARPTEPGGNRVEVFTSNDRQYIGVWGMHSKGRDYGYDGPEITEVAYARPAVVSGGRT